MFPHSQTKQRMPRLTADSAIHSAPPSAWKLLLDLTLRNSVLLFGHCIRKRHWWKPQHPLVWALSLNRPRRVRMVDFPKSPRVSFCPISDRIPGSQRTGQSAKERHTIRAPVACISGPLRVGHHAQNAAVLRQDPRNIVA